MVSEFQATSGMPNPFIIEDGNLFSMQTVCKGLLPRERRSHLLSNAPIIIGGEVEVQKPFNDLQRLSPSSDQRSSQNDVAEIVSHLPSYQSLE